MLYQIWQKNVKKSGKIVLFEIKIIISLIRNKSTR